MGDFGNTNDGRSDGSIKAAVHRTSGSHHLGVRRRNREGRFAQAGNTRVALRHCAVTKEAASNFHHHHRALERTSQSETPSRKSELRETSLTDCTPVPSQNAFTPSPFTTPPVKIARGAERSRRLAEEVVALHDPVVGVVVAGADDAGPGHVGARRRGRRGAVLLPRREGAHVVVLHSVTSARQTVGKPPSRAHTAGPDPKRSSARLGMQQVRP